MNQRYERYKKTYKAYYEKSKEHIIPIVVEYNRKHNKTSYVYLGKVECPICKRYMKKMKRILTNDITNHQTISIIGYHSKKPTHYIRFDS